MTVIKLTAPEQQVLLERFLRYVQVDTQSDENATCSPSTEKQKDLARLLAEELRALGVADAAMDEWGYVTGTVPSNLPAGHAPVPTVGFLAHVDTYHGTPGGGVKPQVLRGYKGGDIALPGTPAAPIPAAKNPNLARCVGHTIVTSDGTTLLGADDKAGVAIIMTLVAWLLAHPELPHGPIRVGFTTDEEVGRGTEHFDVPKFGAQYAYTVDGSEIGEIEDESFSADSAIVTITGHDVHPGYAKNIMINAVRVASAIVEALPQDRLPETTEKREPYLHAYDVRGDVSKVELKLLVRAFTNAELLEREDVLRRVVDGVVQRFPGVQVNVEIKESYRNMAFKIAEDPKVLDHALEAIARQGVTPVRHPIRGGTDGSRLSYMGLLTPNIWNGAQSYHSVHEWVSLEWMTAAAESCLQLVKVWEEKG